MSAEQRRRAPNFTLRDREILIDLIVKYKHILENNKIDAVSSREKEVAWNCIEQEFNTGAVSFKRTWTNLRSCYENMKKRAKKEVSCEKVTRCKTACSETPKSEPTGNQKMESVSNSKVETPLINHFDANVYNGEEDAKMEDDISEAPLQPSTFTVEIEDLDHVEEADETPLAMCHVQYAEDEQSATRASRKVKLQCNAKKCGKAWKECWKSRLRPAVVKGTQKKTAAVTRNVNQSAIVAQKKYYDRLLQIAEEEHVQKMIMLKAKTEYYVRKSVGVIPEEKKDLKSENITIE